MKTIYAFDKITGKYLGGFSSLNPTIPENAGTTDIAPEYANQIFKNGSWTLSTEGKKELLRKKLIQSRKGFLQKEDFRVLRFVEEGTPYPDEIKNKRIKARQEINEIEACTTLTALNQFSEVFE